MRPVLCAGLSALLALLACSVLAADDLETGRKLFSTQLGSNGQSCSSCHPAGKGLEQAAAYEGQRLREIINICIRDALQGQPLPLDDPRLGQLEAYVRSLNK
jgi:mono/diheme cytochrome c family protein